MFGMLSNASCPKWLTVDSMATLPIDVPVSVVWTQLLTPLPGTLGRARANAFLFETKGAPEVAANQPAPAIRTEPAQHANYSLRNAMLGAISKAG
jgi:hypothetical protein